MPRFNILIPPRSAGRLDHIVLTAYLVAPCLLLSSLAPELVAASTSAGKAKHGSFGKPSEVQSLPRFNPYPFVRYPVRIGIARKLPSTHIAVWAPGAVFVDNHPVYALTAQHIYRIAGGRITDLSSGSSYSLPYDRRSIISSMNHIVWAENRWYRGILELINYGSAITAINLLDLEDYLRGVVPSEMPATWHAEALKAQAVAARSYASAHRGAGSSKWMSSEGYDLVPDVRDQVYKGLAVETYASNVAVYSTTGVVLRDAGRVKPGFYRAWVGDTYENLNLRKQIVSGAYLSAITGVPHVVGVTVKKFYPSGNALSVQIMGTKKSREVDGVILANMLNLSTPGILDVEPSGPNWLFTCRGPGNGARGMSQHGANMFAQRGWNYMQILQQYYEDPSGKVQLVVLPEYARAIRFRYAAPAPPASTSAQGCAPAPTPAQTSGPSTTNTSTDDDDKN